MWYQVVFLPDDLSLSIEPNVAESSPHFRQICGVRKPSPRRRALFQLMEEFKDSRCVHARDKVYGIRALALDGLSLEVNYEEPIEDLFFRIVSLHQELSYHSSESLAELRHSAESILSCLSLSQESLLGALEERETDRLWFTAESDGIIEIVVTTGSTAQVSGSRGTGSHRCHVTSERGSGRIVALARWCIGRQCSNAAEQQCVRISHVYIAALTSIVQRTLLVFCRQLRNRIRSYSYDLLISHRYLLPCSPLLRNIPWTHPRGAVHNTLAVRNSDI
jgi:hypothetical protein